MTARAAPRQSRWSWRSQALRGLIFQVVALALVGWGLFALAHNTAGNLQARGIQSGFDFLTSPAGFDIGESVFAYDALDPYWRAFLVGVMNTVRVAVLGIALASVLGVVLGVGRFSRNAIVRGLCYAYVELFRNIPVLLQLLLWYLLFAELLPPVFDALSIGGLVYLSKSGLSFPVPIWDLGQALAAAGGLLGALAAWRWRARALQHFARTGQARPVWLPMLACVVGMATLGWLAGGAPTAWSVPRPEGFAMNGGASLTPEFAALLFGLVLYTAAFIAEVVRAGIASVARGQAEAAASLGLSRAQAMRLVILPQALRVIVPPLTSQYLNLAKNSSLAVAIGYPDVVSIANTAINQTGRALECIAIVMLVYLSISLSTSALMNAYNRRAALKER